jgi:hypothetical protein
VKTHNPVDWATTAAWASHPPWGIALGTVIGGGRLVVVPEHARCPAPSSSAIVAPVFFLCGVSFDRRQLNSGGFVSFGEVCLVFGQIGVWLAYPIAQGSVSDV